MRSSTGCTTCSRSVPPPERSLTLGRDRRYGPGRDVPVPPAPALDPLHPRRRRGDRRDDQPRVLAVAPPRRAARVQRHGRGPHRPTSGRPRRVGPSRRRGRRRSAEGRRVAAGRGVRSLPRRRGRAHRQPLTGRPRRRLHRHPVAPRRRAHPARRPRVRGPSPKATRLRHRRERSPSRGVCDDRRCVAPARCRTRARAS